MSLRLLVACSSLDLSDSTSKLWFFFMPNMQICYFTVANKEGTFKVEIKRNRIVKSAWDPLTKYDASTYS